MSKLHKINLNQRLGSSRCFQISDEIRSVFLLLEACIHHLGSWYVLLGVGEVLVQCVLTPGDSLVLVCLSEVEPRGLSSLTSPNSMKIWTLLVFTSIFYSMTLGTSLGENLLTVLGTHNLSFNLL